MYIDLVTINLCPGQGGGGVKPSGTLDIVENGVYNVYSYSSASVDVHPSISLSETYTSNGSYNITGEFSGGVITVDVPAPQFVTETLNVSNNGTYTPGEGVDGYSQVVVDVPQSVTGFTQKEITEGVQIADLSNSASYVHPFVFEKDNYLQTVNLPNCTSVGENAFKICINLKTVNLPECETISSSAFQYCYSLSNINMPNVKTIEDGAFNSCFSLTGILSLPLCLNIGSYTFFDCKSLLQVSLPVCSFIGGNAFYNCSSLSQISLPMCSRILGSAFCNCYSLSQISLPMCSDIGTSAFYNCSSLLQVNLPVCSVIGGNAFYNCSSLLQVNLPVCSFIGSYAFYNCSSLLQVSLPVCSYIRNGVFRNCSSLSIITIGYSSVCSLYNSNVFINTQITSSTGSIYVPASLVDSYKSEPDWSYFSTQIFPIE